MDTNEYGYKMAAINWMYRFYGS